MRNLLRCLLFLVSLSVNGQSVAMNTKIAYSYTPDNLLVYVDTYKADLTRNTPTTYYVETTGSSGNSGTSIGSPWDLATAMSSAPAGALVHVKIGQYPKVTQSADGTATNGIIYRGYKTSPNDIISFQTSTYVQTSASDEPLSTEYPMIEGLDSVVSDQYGIIVDGDYVQLENFVSADWKIGVIWNGNDGFMKNVITHSCYVGAQLGSLTLGDRLVVENSFALNHGSTAYGFRATNAVIRNSIAWSDMTTEPSGADDLNSGMAYFFLMDGNQNSVVEGCTAYRIPSTAGGFGGAHQGHGFVGKFASENNTWRNSVSYNTGIEANFGDVTSNIWQDIEIYGDNETYTSQFSASIRVLNGAHDNIFNRIFMKGAKYVFEWVDFDDGQAGSDLNDGSVDNDFTNIHADGYRGVLLVADSEFTGPASNSTGNNIVNSTFKRHYGGGPPFVINHNIATTKFINCNFQDCSTSYQQDTTNSPSVDYTFEYTNFFNNGWPTPSGTSITTLTPLYVGGSDDILKHQLASNSPTKDIGVTTALTATDILGATRPEGVGYDIGAFEFGGVVTPPTNTVTNTSWWAW